MVWLQTLLIVVQVISALVMIGLILVQHGKGADMGAAFGSGSSGSLFGASGSANFLSRTTAIMAVVFFCCTLGLAFLGNVRPSNSGSVLDQVTAPPAAPSTLNAPASSASGSTVEGAVPPGSPATAAPVSSGSVGSPVNQIPSK